MYLVAVQVNMIKGSDEVIHFANPKVQAAIAANTFCITGTAEIKQIPELLPDIIQQLGPESIEGLKALAEKMGAAPGAAAGDEPESDGEVPGESRCCDSASGPHGRQHTRARKHTHPTAAPVQRQILGDRLPLDCAVPSLTTLSPCVLSVLQSSLTTSTRPSRHAIRKCPRVPRATCH